MIRSNYEEGDKIIFTSFLLHLLFPLESPWFGLLFLWWQESSLCRAPLAWFSCICQLSLMPGGDWNKHRVLVQSLQHFCLTGLVVNKRIWWIVELFTNWQLWLEWNQDIDWKGDSLLRRSAWNNNSWISPGTYVPWQ